MMVIARRAAATMWESASHHPARMSRRMLPSVEAAFASGRLTAVRPNGQQRVPGAP